MMHEETDRTLTAELVEIAAELPDGSRHLLGVGNRVRAPRDAASLRIVMAVSVTGFNERTIVNVEVVEPGDPSNGGTYEERTISGPSWSEQYVFELQLRPGSYHFLARVTDSGPKTDLALIVETA